MDGKPEDEGKDAVPQPDLPVGAVSGDRSRDDPFGIIPTDMRIPTEEETIRAMNSLWRIVAVETLDAVRKMKSGAFDDVAKLDQIVKELKATGRLALDEWRRLDQFRRQPGGKGRDTEVDFDDARAEVEGKLARIIADAADEG
jgi:hypothetical protein